MIDADFRRLAGRADVARLLSASYYEPGPELAEERVFESLEAAAGSVDSALGAAAKRLRHAFEATDEQSRLVDYIRLFHGPPRALAQPYGAVWMSTDPAVMQESTLSVLGLYRDAGFDMAEDFRDLPDHVSVELECLYVLLFREAQLRRQEEPEEARAAAAQRAQLLSEHLGRWAVPFSDAVTAAAQTAFYRELGAVTKQFIEGEIRALS